MSKKNQTERFELGKYYKVEYKTKFEGEEEETWTNYIRVTDLMPESRFDLKYVGFTGFHIGGSKITVSSSIYYSIEEISWTTFIKHLKVTHKLFLEKFAGER